MSGRDLLVERPEEGINQEILRCVVGSELHGIHVVGQEDHDEMGVAVERREWVLGLRNFEQATRRTQPEGRRSGPDDIDLVVYGLRKWARLALNGNPSVIVLLFAPERFTLHETGLGALLRSDTDSFASKRSARAFLGYLTQQYERLLGIRGGRHTNRPELVERYGYDTKYAMHALRLGYQGIEYATTGRLTLPMRDEERQRCLDVRRGGVSKTDCIAEVEHLRDFCENAFKLSPLPDKPDTATVERLMIDIYEQAWGSAPADKRT